MSEYLTKKDENLKNKPFTDWYIDDILWVSNATDDEFEQLISRNRGIFNNSIKKVSDCDALIAINLYNTSFNLLIKSILDYLISFSNHRNQSNLVKDLEEFINLYFNNIKEINGGLPAHNLVTLLKWTITKFPKSKTFFNNILFEKIMSFDSSEIKAFSLAEYLISKKDVCSILTSTQYSDIFQKYYIETTDVSHVKLHVGLYIGFLNYFKENDRKIYKKLLKQYCNFVLKNLDLFDNNSALSIFPRVRKYMDDVNEYLDSDYLKVDEKIKFAGKEAIKGMQQIEIDLPKEMKEQLKNVLQMQTASFNSLTNSEKIDKLLFESDPFSLEELKRYYDSYKEGFSAMVEESVIDEDGKPIYYSDLSKEEAFSLRANGLIRIQIKLIFDLLISPFFKSFVMDDSATIYIKRMLTNNKLIPYDKINTMLEIISSFFEQNFRHSIYELCEELEDCIRYYLKSEGMNIYKRDKSGDVIGLNNVFNTFKKNTFRDKLLETIDEDFYFTLEWFLTDAYGFGLKNRISHRYNSKDLYKTRYSIFAAIQIIRLIWGFQN